MVSTDNSTFENLDADEVFTGEWEDALNFGCIIIGIKADQASATNGLEVQWSADGENKIQDDVFTIAANSGKVFTFTPANRYFRIVYTNGGSAQTSFNLQTILKRYGFKPSSHRINDSIIEDDDAELVKAVLSGEDKDGSFQNVQTTRDGNLTISDNSNGLSIAEGNVTGKTFVHKFGLAPDFDTVDGEVNVWDGANDGNIDQMVYQWSTSAAIDSISSSNAADTQNIQIQGLDENWELTVQTVTLDGQTRVALTTPLLRVFRAKNAGTTALAGIVSVYENTALTGGIPTDTTKIRLVINNGNNQTLMALYSVPAGKTAYMRDWYAATAGSSKSSQYIIRLWAREYIEASAAYSAWQLKHITSISDIATSHIQHKYNDPEKFSAKVDIMMTVEATATGASEASVAAGFDIVLVDD